MSTVNTIYYCNNGCIQIPEGWEDKTIISLTYPAGAKQATASFTIVKDTLKDNEITLAAYVDNHLQAVKEFSNFRLLEHKID
ncbi:protein containing DUF1795 [Candidatus Magnetomorum sp. HK-1]|nr:protein containing DUF1795 [Candidatus Magnetomorum sp. HK-1]